MIRLKPTKRLHCRYCGTTMTGGERFCSVECRWTAQGRGMALTPQEPGRRRPPAVKNFAESVPRAYGRGTR